MNETSASVKYALSKGYFMQKVFFYFRYDPLSGIWIEQSPILTARQKFAATVFEDKIFIFGKMIQR